MEETVGEGRTTVSHAPGTLGTLGTLVVGPSAARGTRARTRART